MKQLLTTLTIVYISSIINLSAQEQIRVIPYPANVTLQTKTSNLKSGQKINYTDSALRQEASFLKQRLADMNYQMEENQGKKITKGISLLLDNTLKNREAYVLTVKSNQIIIKGGSSAGVFYGIQTLLQILTNGDLRCGEIRDAPRYEWRGYMLDEARHFSGEKRVKQLLDLMAYYKMNRFHWHLTDAQGWRIEIKQYPKLATVGGEGCHSDPDTPALYYTQEQIRDIVTYAKVRHIEIIPEIDMPGHATAANKAYPEYSGGGTKEHPEFTFNVGKERTYTYLSNILKEVAYLFPSPYMHIGGDEVAYGSQAWETDPSVQDLMKRKGLKTVKEAERYFMHQMTNTVRSLGKTLVGWDELLDLNVKRTNTIIMWWRHDKPEYLRSSLAKEYATIMCPRKPLYFDFVQYDGHQWGRIWDGFCPLEDVYAFPDKWFAEWGVSAADLSYVKGIQANAWTELMHTKERVDFMTFPRLCALAESAWSEPTVKNYGKFQSRLEDAFTLFDKLNIYYFDYRDLTHHPEPVGPIIKKK
ncbi:Beta-hexosaminidase [termite gut metagenome]|jgi:hexosaminidase|uniref:beta-N-acetylhexosaminidase n=1 Tax=termite gut metagenome TaxID=433724 RepID=A0A5J4T008_9ZZZZ